MQRSGMKNLNIYKLISPFGRNDNVKQNHKF